MNLKNIKKKLEEAFPLTLYGVNETIDVETTYEDDEVQTTLTKTVVFKMKGDLFVDDPGVLELKYVIDEDYPLKNYCFEVGMWGHMNPINLNSVINKLKEEINEEISS